MGVNVGVVLRQAALRSPDRMAVTEARADGSGVTSISCRELDESARRIGRGLREAGVNTGQPVALVAGNTSAFIRGWFGVIYAGGVVVPIPTGVAPIQLASRVRHSGCVAILADDDGTTLGGARPAGIPLLELEGLAGGDPLPLEVLATSAGGDRAMILYTSGTTGHPRAAVISHGALLVHTAALVHHTLGLGADDVVLGVLPLAHSFGCRMVMLCGLFAGARIVLMRRFDAVGSLALAGAEGVTWIPAVPTMFARWAGLPDGPPPGRLRWCLSAGAPLPDDVRVRAEHRLGAEVREGYGLTEATFTTVNAPPDRRVPGSVGRPTWGVEVRLADGEVLVRGPNVMDGYLDAPTDTSATLVEGWVHTGDLGRLDDEGRLVLVGRIKDLILRGGHSIAPAEVEEALASHPDVAEVAVVGRPDPSLGEEVVAFVVPVPGRSPEPGELVVWTRDRVGHAAYPREIVVTDHLAMGPSGKVLKRVLRDALASGDVAPIRPAGS